MLLDKNLRETCGYKNYHYTMQIVKMDKLPKKTYLNIKIDYNNKKYEFEITEFDLKNLDLKKLLK